MPTSYFPELPAFNWNQPYFLLGLTGGIGSGKSTASKAFTNAGATVLDADKIARDILNSSELAPLLRNLFGDSIIQNSQVDRSAIAKQVFSNPDQLNSLNNLIHPRVQKTTQDFFSKLYTGTICVYDVPLLFETSQQTKLDHILVVTAPTEIRLERVKKRNGWSESQFQEREQNQISLVEKEQLADLVISNTQGVSYLQEAVLIVYKAILASRPKN